MLDVVVILLSAFLSILLPVAIITARQSVKLQRQEVIKDLSRMLEPTPTHSGEERIIPSFEFVKFKYFMDETEPSRASRDFSLGAFSLSSVPLVLMLFLLGMVAFGSVLELVWQPRTELHVVPRFAQTNATERQLWLSVLVVAYLGTYLYVVRDLLRAVANFDLSPTTLLASAIHVLFGAVTAVIIAVVASEIFPQHETTAAALLVAAFAIGFVPELGVRTLLRASRLRLFKQSDSDVYKTYLATPVEVVDGINTEVQSRLAMNNIVAVQNLATANPIMLFVETPFGIYQIIDWVAQAQLFSALGAKAVTEFWRLGIRTIFDLERAVLSPSSTPKLRLQVGQIIVSGLDQKSRERMGLGHESLPSEETDRTVLALSRVLLDDPHVHRLRQILNRIVQRLGKENLRLLYLNEDDNVRQVKEYPECRYPKDLSTKVPFDLDASSMRASSNNFVKSEDA